MAIPPTDWKSRVTDLNLVGPDGRPLVVDMLFGSDDTVAADMTDRLDAGESLTSVAATFWKLRALGETVDVDVSGASLVGAPQVVGAAATQRISGLERGRVYKLEVLYGVAGNRRGNTLFVRVPE